MLKEVMGWTEPKYAVMAFYSGGWRKGLVLWINEFEPELKTMGYSKSALKKRINELELAVQAFLVRAKTAQKKRPAGCAASVREVPSRPAPRPPQR